MSTERIKIADVATDADIAELRDKIHEFNFATTGYHDGRSLSCFLRDGSGTLYAGIDGFTWGGYARIDYLWVDESRRRRGLGRALLMAAEDDERLAGEMREALPRAPWCRPPREAHGILWLEAGR